MNPPRILVVDDQLVHDETERNIFLDGVGLNPSNTSPWAEVVFCSGQREEGMKLTNDYDVVKQAVASADWALVLLDVQFDSGERDSSGRPAGQEGDDSFGIVVQRILVMEYPDLPVIMLTGKRQEEIGESDVPYLSKYKLGAHELKLALLRHGRMEVEAKRALLGLDDSIQANAPATIAAFRKAFIHARSDASVLILGESGTGKEVLASYVHRMSKRKHGPFIAVNVAALPRDLVESELFGIASQTATQVRSRMGKFELADRGTLFLDEIGDMAMDVQAKVLRALHGKIMRVGESVERDIDIRVICATSRDLEKQVESGEFRYDLLYRINTVQITMPPLRERKEDIAPLARGFVDKYSKKQDKVGLSLSDGALELLKEQPFYGNVRELEHVAEQLVGSAGHYQVISQRELLEVLGTSKSTKSTKSMSTATPCVISKPSTLTELLEVLKEFTVDKDDPGLKGVLSKLDEVVNRLKLQLAGAALAKFINPNTEKPIRQAAMRYLTGDSELKGRKSGQIINRFLNREPNHEIRDEDMNYLVELWRQGNH